MFSAEQNSMSVRPGMGMSLLVEWWMVLCALQFSSLVLLQDLVGSSSEDLFKPLPSKYKLVSLNLDQDVGLAWVNHHAEVCWQGPRGCGPYEYELSWFLDQWEFNVDREVLNGSIFVCHLVPGEGSFAAGTPVDYLQSLVEKTLLLGSLDSPPDGFDVAVFVCQIGIIPVHPDPEVFQNPRLSLDVFLCEFLAVADKSVHSDNILNILFRAKLQRLLYHYFNWKTMAVIARLIVDVEPFHPVVSDHDVFQRLVPGKPNMRSVCYVWRTI